MADGLEGRRAFITGAGGQDGSYLAEHLLRLGYHVVGLVRSTRIPPYLDRLSAAYGPDRFAVLIGDIGDIQRLDAFLRDYQPDEVYNLAAQSHVGRSWHCWSETLRVNADAAIELMLLCARLRSRTGANVRFYQASTSELYGDTPPPQSETSPMSPMSPYGLSKLTAHMAAGLLRRTGRLWCVCGILFNHESPRRSIQFVTRRIAYGAALLARGHDGAVALGNLEPRRDWGWAPEYVEAIHRLVQADEPRDLVIATGESHSVREFAQAALEAAGVQRPFDEVVQSVDSLRRDNEVWDLRGDPSLAQKIIGWQPQVRFHEVVRRMVQAAFDELGQDA